MKQIAAIFLLSFSIAAHAQCVISINSKYGVLLQPFSTSSHWEEVPCDTIGWREYLIQKSIKKISGEFSVFSSKGLVGKTKIISVDTSHDESNGPDCGPTIEFSQEFTEKNLYAIKANWNVQPRPVTTINNSNAVYEKAVKDILDKVTGLKNAKAVITKIVKADLDGDKKDEVIIYASNHTNVYDVDKGSYSLAIVRRVVNEQVVTDVLHFRYLDISASEFSAKYQYSPVVNVYNISAILDLNGDGKMELLITDEEHEGNGITAYELTPEGIKAVLDWGCGV
jgi:hypothetical protein